MRQEGKTQKQIASHFGVSEDTIGRCPGWKEWREVLEQEGTTNSANSAEPKVAVNHKNSPQTPQTPPAPQNLYYNYNLDLDKDKNSNINENSAACGAAEGKAITPLSWWKASEDERHLAVEMFLTKVYQGRRNFDAIAEFFVKVRGTSSQAANLVNPYSAYTNKDVWDKLYPHWRAVAQEKQIDNWNELSSEDYLGLAAEVIATPIDKKSQLHSLTIVE